MMDSLRSEVSRRNFLIASCGLLLPRTGWTSNLPVPVLHWPLEGLVAPGRESVTGSEAAIIDTTGRLAWMSDAAAKLPRLDGYSVWFEHALSNAVPLGRALTVSAWVALEAFPVGTASVIEWGDTASGVSLAVDCLGFALFAVRHASNELKCRSQRPIERGIWVHLSATLGAEGVCTLFVDGGEVARSEPAGATPELILIERVYLGRAIKEAVVAKVFPTNVLNGFIRQVRVYGEACLPHEIKGLSAEFEHRPAPLDAAASWFVGDAQRPGYHAMPPRAWTNEPHGLVHWRGQYHLFYQKNPNGPFWGHIHWGHMTSSDLLQWTEQRIALTPEPGPDSEGCWSGCAIVARDKLYVFYAAGDGKRTSICMASSEDGLHFQKHAGNPIIDAPPSTIGVKEFRDPFVWQEGAEFRMIIGSGVTDVGGTALLYSSTDLISWRYLKPIFVGDKADSGVFWEMPILVKIADHRVLIVCEVPGRASYWVGTWEKDEFKPLHKEPRRLDLFNHFLSPTPYIDANGRAIAIGIVPETRSSLEQWQASWAHLYGVPRELSLDEELQLHQTPIQELSARFIPLLAKPEKQALSTSWTVIEAAGTRLSVKLRFERGSSKSVALALRRSPDRQEETILGYDWQNAQLSLDRTKSSMNVHTARDLKQVDYRPPVQDVIDFHVLLDQSVLEVFLDGQACFASRMYPCLPESIGLAASAEGGIASISHLEVTTAAMISGYNS